MTSAIIIARGGSKRLPRKNAKPFCGLPLLAWSVIQCKCSHLVDRVYLSTDDDEMAQIGEDWGAEIIRRPKWEDADLVAANRVYLHALDVIEERGDWPDVMLSVFPTSPLRFPDDIDKGLAHFEVVGGPHVIPVAPMRETFLYKNSCDITAKGWIRDKAYGYFTGNSGAFSISKPTWYRWFVNKLIEAFGGDHDNVIDMASADQSVHPDSDTYYVTCKPWQCTETDTLEEFELAEVLMEHYILKGRGIAPYYEYAGISVPVLAGNWKQQQ